MSRLAGGAIELIARTLPAPVRERHREEWLADAAAARENGIRPGSIVSAAATYSLLLDRSLPEVAGFAAPQLARRHAQWALALAGLTVLIVQSRLLAVPNAAWLPLALILVVAILCHLWTAARLSPGAGRAAATFVTAGLAAFAAASTLPIVVSDAVPGSHHLPTAASALLVIGFVFGLVAWGRAMGRAALVALSLGAGLAWALAAGLIPLPPPLSPTPVVFAALTAVAVVAFVRTRRRPADDGRGARTVTVAFATAGLLAVCYELAVQLVLNPLAAAPSRRLEEIYASIPERTLSIAVGDIVIVAAVSVIAVTVYLAGFFAVIRRGGGHARSAVAAGAALLALVLVANSSSAVALYLAMWREFGMRQGFSGDLTRELMSIAAAVAIVALIAPPSQPRVAAVDVES